MLVRSHVSGFLLKVLFFAPLLLVMVGFNYAVDPADVFRPGEYEPAAARLLLQGSNVDGYMARDDRLVEKFYIDGMAQSHQIGVMGSSRMMQFNADQFPGRRFFNYSVFGSTIQDFVATYTMLRRRGLAPSSLILGIDPWTFSARANDGRWHSVWLEYAEGARLLGLSGRELRRPFPVAQISELFSLRYFQESFFTWASSPTGRRRVVPVATSERDGPRTIKRVDGSLSYDAEFRLRAPEAVRAGAVALVKTSPYMEESFARPDDTMKVIFERLLSLLERDGVIVALWRTPLHPVVYGALEANETKRRGMAELNDYCSRVAAARRMSFVGSFDPGDYSLGDADFYDGLHPKEHVVAGMVKRSGLLNADAGSASTALAAR